MTQMVDFSRYVPPGVLTESVAGPQIGVISNSPTSVGIFGDTAGYRADVETVIVPADITDPVGPVSLTLRQQGIDVASIVVRDVANGTEYLVDDDYSITQTDAGVVGDTTDNPTTLVRVVGGLLDAGTTIQVSYRFTDADYHELKVFYDFDDVRDTYGPAFNTSGEMVSELTLASGLAFRNGAQRIVCVAAKKTVSGTPDQAAYEDALTKLLDDANIAVVVPATGDQALHAAVKDHVNTASANKMERRALVGRDGSQNPVASSTRISDAQALNNKRVAMVSPATVGYYNSDANRVQTIGGHFKAAALAGVDVSLNPAMPLTRKVLQGFTTLPEKMTDTQKTLETRNGLLVVEETRAGVLRVRHGVTTAANATITSREWSLVRQEDTLTWRIRETLDTDSLIGGIVDELTMSNVKSAVDSALSELVNSRVILGYSDLKIRQLPNALDVLEVRFEWRAAMPLNNIVARYSVNVTTAEFTATDV